jgi:hypothetical protein
MVAVTILVAVIGVLALLGFVVYRIDPKRFKLTIEGGWKQVRLNVEADSGPGTYAEKPPEGLIRAVAENEPKELPDGERPALPPGEQRASPTGSDA